MFSFNPLTHTAPAPAPVLLAMAGAGALSNPPINGPGKPSNPPINGGDVSDQCHKALTDLDVKLCAKLDLLKKCLNTKEGDCKSIVAQIVADIQVCIHAITKLSGTIDIKLIVMVQLVVSIFVKIATACGMWVVQLGLAVFLEIFACIDAILVALVNGLVKLCVFIVPQIKLVLAVNAPLLVAAHFTCLTKLLGVCA